jgi:hypothetical protein
LAVREAVTSQRIQRMAGIGARSEGSKRFKMDDRRTDDDHFRDDHRSNGTRAVLIDADAVLN